MQFQTCNLDPGILYYEGLITRINRPIGKFYRRTAWSANVRCKVTGNQFPSTGQGRNNTVKVQSLIGIAVAAALTSSAQAQKTASPPNIVIFLADDLGYGDLGIQGDKQAVTPNIDALAAKGVRLTDFYANHPVCSPSRAALMTGIYQHRMGFEQNSGSPQNTSPKFGITADRKTLPERLKAAGYATGMFGKWHVGFTPERVPTARGFDTFYGFLSGAHAYTPKPNAPAGGGQGGDFGGGQTMLRGTVPEPMPAHTTEAFADNAVAFIDANKQRPFFVYLPFNAVHSPMDTTKLYSDRFAEVKDETRRIHLAQLSALDDAVGKVVGELDKQGLLDNTLIIFSSDNGGPTQETTSSNGPLNGVKGLVLEGGIRVPTIFSWKGHLPQGKVIPTMSMGFDLTATTLKAAGVLPARGLDGVDLMPYLTGARTGEAHKALFWRSGTQGAVREGDWKLIRVGEARHLFNLKADIGERHDLAKSDPKRVAAMDKTWTSWSSQMMAPQWRRNELAGGDPDNRAMVTKAIQAFIDGKRVVIDGAD